MNWYVQICDKYYEKEGMNNVFLVSFLGDSFLPEANRKYGYGKFLDYPIQVYSNNLNSKNLNIK
jgi:hypothetical protein